MSGNRTYTVWCASGGVDIIKEPQENNSNKQKFKAKENKRVMKTVVFFDKIVANTKSYYPRRFYQAE